VIRAWRNEILCLVAVALVLTALGVLVGEVRLLLALGLLAYLGWHLVNFLLLQSWIARRRSFHLPVSLGIWEAVFDGFQREQLRKRRRRRQLVTSLSDSREAANALQDALVVLSDGGIVRWSNPSAYNLLGLGGQRDLGKDIRRIVDHPVLEDGIAEGRASRPMEVPSPANGALMLSIQVTAPFGNQRERLLVARDITASFRLEQARRDFLASVSHELRTPITVFRGYLEALQDAALDHLEWRKPVMQMDQQAQRMQILVDDLITLSRLELSDRPPAETPVAVPDMLSDIVAEARALSGDRNHDLRLTAAPGLWLKGEESELHSAFSNLIFNAVRHTPSGTRVDIKWQGDKNGASVTVQDSGSGIASYHLPRLTERFYRVEAGRSREAGGSGLGLSIVKQVLDRYSADLRIASVIGEGTTFSCQFPGLLVETKPVITRSEVC